MEKYFIRDKIKEGEITYNIGDEVVLIRRKKNGYPKFLKENTIYIIEKVENDFLIISKHSNDKFGFLQPIKINKIYVCNRLQLRDIKINGILN